MSADSTRTRERRKARHVPYPIALHLHIAFLFIEHRKKNTYHDLMRNIRVSLFRFLNNVVGTVSGNNYMMML